MASFNQITVLGNCVRDPETRRVGAHSVCKTSIAINNKRGGKEETLFLNVVLWNKTGEIAQQYLTKGSSVLFSGRLACDTYEAKDGTKKQDWHIIANEMQLLSKRGEHTQTGFQGSNRQEAPIPTEEPEF
jgi:single-strand DNA-binding protein